MLSPNLQLLSHLLNSTENVSDSLGRPVYWYCRNNRHTSRVSLTGILISRKSDGKTQRMKSTVTESTEPRPYLSHPTTQVGPNSKKVYLHSFSICSLKYHNRSSNDFHTWYFRLDPPLIIIFSRSLLPLLSPLDKRNLLTTSRNPQRKEERVRFYHRKDRGIEFIFPMK